MWKYMESSKPSVFVRDYDQGIARVKRGGYAFLMESTVLDYVVQRDCNLTQIGGLLDSKGKKNYLEAPGIDPGTSRMLSERSTI